MSESHQPLQRHSQEDTLPPLKAEWAELRSLLLAPEQIQINELRDRLEHTAPDASAVSTVLAEAIALRGRHDDRLTNALTPHIETALSASVRRNPHVIADAITPVMGPAIRQSIVRTLQNMMQSFNQALDQSLSPKGLRWRIESWRTGRPFAEVVLLHTLRFRVEQVFLIHRETGLLLHHVAADHIAFHDQQLVSGMLSAIQRFVQESFGTPEGQALNTLEVGECRLLIEQGPQAILASVVRGVAPNYLRPQIQQVLESIHIDFADELAGFDGNTSRFDSTHERLQGCIQAQYESPRSRMSPWTGLVLAGVCLGLAVWSWNAYAARQQWDRLSHRLRSTPGLVVTTFERQGNSITLAGLRDPLSDDPAAIVSEAGFLPDHVTARWTPFHSLEPAFVERRAESLLHPPDSVELRLEDGRLTAIGSAGQAWAEDARRLAPLIPGIREYQDRELRIVTASDLINQLKQITFYFDSGSSILSEQELLKVAPTKALLTDLRETARISGRSLRVEAIGDADETGPESMNLLLATARAHAVLAVLGGSRTDPHLSLTPMIDPASFTKRRRAASKQEQDQKRRVTLQVRLSGDASRASFPP